MRDYFRKSIPVTVKATGAVVRASVRCHVYDGSLAPDTWFSTPASIRHKGRYVTGYVTGKEGVSNLEFRHHDKHNDLLRLTR